MAQEKQLLREIFYLLKHRPTGSLMLISLPLALPPLTLIPQTSRLPD